MFQFKATTVNSGQSGLRLIRISATPGQRVLSLQTRFNTFYSGQSGLCGIRTVLAGPFSVRIGRSWLYYKMVGELVVPNFRDLSDNIILYIRSRIPTAIILSLTASVRRCGRIVSMISLNAIAVMDPCPLTSKRRKACNACSTCKSCKKRVVTVLFLNCAPAAWLKKRWWG